MNTDTNMNMNMNMNPDTVRYNPSRRRATCSNGSSRGNMVSFSSLLVSFAVFQCKFQSTQSFVFVPSVRVLQTTHFPVTSSNSRLKQQLVQIEPLKNNGVVKADNIDIEKINSSSSSNNTGSFGTLHPRKDDVYPITRRTRTSSRNNTESFETLYPRKDNVFPSRTTRTRPSPLKLSKASIESTVDDLLTSTRSMGIFDESSTMFSSRQEEESSTFESKPKGNTVLARSAVGTSVRVATSVDALDIANLRLSVFSNFNPEMLQLFCDRSCQLLSSRRQRGATCIVATTTKANKNYGSGNSNAEQQQTTSVEVDVDGGNDTNKKPEHNIVGTAEISFHEFSRTLLGYSRPKDSVLYVTEVAVDLDQRRKGIARLMMESIDALAKIREVETIYLHVDVTNSGAVRLYENAGYRKLNSTNPMYLEFTTKLNLHDGATKGRCHYLMAKNVRTPTWLNIQEQRKQYEPQKRKTLGIEVMSSF